MFSISKSFSNEAVTPPIKTVEGAAAAVVPTLFNAAKLTDDNWGFPCKVKVLTSSIESATTDSKLSLSLIINAPL